MAGDVAGEREARRLLDERKLNMVHGNERSIVWLNQIVQACRTIQSVGWQLAVW